MQDNGKGNLHKGRRGGIFGTMKMITVKTTTGGDTNHYRLSHRHPRQDAANEDEEEGGAGRRLVLGLLKDNKGHRGYN